MTDAQKYKFYFPAWTACVRANGWRKERGRVVLDGGASRNDELAKVLTFATQRALQAGRSLAVDDLRHGCHWLALGRDKSSADLTNADLDRVVNVFELLTDPDNLAVRLKFDAYLRGEDPGAIARVEYFIRRCPDAYVRALSAGKFGTRQWENLTISQKKQLSMTLANRKPAQPGQSDNGRSKMEDRTCDLENEPF